MQWLLLVVTLVVLALLQKIARATGGGGGGSLEAQATLALGSLTLVAYIAGAIVQRFRLPRIIGYLAAGFVAGPAWLKLARGPELQALDVISSGALTLIAFAVGNELTLDPLRGARRSALLRIVAGAMAGPFAFVALVVLTISPWFPLTAHQPFRDALVVALALGTMAAVSSPTLTWAVISDVAAEGQGPGRGGPLSRAMLDVSVLQDLVAVVLLVVVLAVALPLGSSGAVRPGVAVRALLILGGSIVAGIGLGVATTPYLRVIQHHLVWLLVVFAIVVAQLVRLTGMDAALLGLAAGCALRNVAPEHSERVRAELKRCAMPVYVVFFALAGSNLRFDVLADMWPWALLLVALRVTGLWGGLRWAGTGGPGGPGGAVSADWTNHGWLGLVSQGGLAVTLAAVLRRAFPEWNVTLEALLVAMIGVHHLAGPICFNWVLRRAGEVTQSAGVGEANAQDGAAVASGDSVVADGGSRV
ncbi:MAG TPA: cation:proton antiporter [Gemmatimonadales bacterium]|nr:cation:proton antiporter [Gemmatimonadales bacterium]